MTKFAVWALLMVAYRVCAPVGWVVAVAVLVTHVCQPPVEATGMLASTVLVGEPVRSWMVPVVPLSDDRRAPRVSVPAPPKSTLS